MPGSYSTRSSLKQQDRGSTSADQGGTSGAFRILLLPKNVSRCPFALLKSPPRCALADSLCVSVGLGLCTADSWRCQGRRMYDRDLWSLTPILHRFGSHHLHIGQCCQGRRQRLYLLCHPLTRQLCLLL